MRGAGRRKYTIRNPCPTLQQVSYDPVYVYVLDRSGGLGGAAWFSGGRTYQVNYMTWLNKVGVGVATWVADQGHNYEATWWDGDNCTCMDRRATGLILGMYALLYVPVRCGKQEIVV